MKIERVTSTEYDVLIEAKDKNGKPVSVRVNFPCDNTLIIHSDFVDMNVKKPHFANQMEIELKRDMW